jgi:hypothetical protein
VLVAVDQAQEAILYLVVQLLMAADLVVIGIMDLSKAGFRGVLAVAVVPDKVVGHLHKALVAEQQDTETQVVLAQDNPIATLVAEVAVEQALLEQVEYQIKAVMAETEDNIVFLELVFTTVAEAVVVDTMALLEVTVEQVEAVVVEVMLAADLVVATEEIAVAEVLEELVGQILAAVVVETTRPIHHHGVLEVQA